MRAPSTYAEWVAVIDDFGNKVDDPNTIAMMKAGSLSWQDGVAERFSNRLVGAVNKRLNAAMDRFARDQKNSHGDEGSIHRALYDLRHEYITVMEAVNIPALPEKYRVEYTKLVKEEADKAQDSLETSVKSFDRSGKLVVMLKNIPVNKF